MIFLINNPIEINPTISIEDKKKAMKEWWEKHFELLKKCGLRKDEIEKAMQSNKIKLRKGVSEFLNFLHKYDIPLVIISSSGLGEDSISLCLQRNNVLFSNIYIISNSLIWDEEGNMIGAKEPIIHCMNKDQTMVKDFPAYSKIKDRRNVLLLGDSLGDIGMIEGFDYNNLIKSGFLNDEVDKSLEEYKKNYDILILNDSSMDYVNGLLNEIIKS